LNRNNKKNASSAVYPTQAKIWLEWGTQPWLPVERQSLQASRAFGDLLEPFDDGARVSGVPRQLDIADCFCAAQWKTNHFA
jgi:hypothetical protein